MEAPDNVSEYWFLEFYRVLVTRIDNENYVSVDVYREEWPWSLDGSTKICVKDEEYCLLYHVIDRDLVNKVFDKLAENIVKVEAVGVKTGDKLETVNVRYIIRGELKYNDIEQLFYNSWKLIGCSPPSIEELPIQ